MPLIFCSNLGGNNLQGSLPDGLIEKEKNGSLSLRFNYFHMYPKTLFDLFRYNKDMLYFHFQSYHLNEGKKKTWKYIKAIFGIQPKLLSLFQLSNLNILSSFVDSSVDGNPNLCLSASCKGKNNKFIVPLLASVVSFSVLLAALAILRSLRRRKQGTRNHHMTFTIYLGLRCCEF